MHVVHCGMHVHRNNHLTLMTINVLVKHLLVASSSVNCSTSSGSSSKGTSFLEQRCRQRVFCSKQHSHATAAATATVTSAGSAALQSSVLDTSKEQHTRQSRQSLYGARMFCIVS
jgi:hypothetical protein